MTPFTRWLADATEMAANTGPAQGTKTRPRLRPSTKPPPERAYLDEPSRLNGRSTQSPIAGTIRPRARTSKSEMPSQYRKS